MLILDLRWFMRSWFSPRPSNVEESATGALLGRELVFTGTSFMEKLSRVGFEVNRDETMFRGGFFDEGAAAEPRALYFVSVIRFFVTVGPSFIPPSGYFRFPSVLDFLLCYQCGPRTRKSGHTQLEVSLLKSFWVEAGRMKY
jgi:hypothetical protein